MANRVAEPAVEPVPLGPPDQADSGPVSLHAWQPSLRERVVEAWQSRDLLVPIGIRTVPTYPGRVLGRTWLVLRPFMQVFGFGVVFAGVFRAKGPDGTPYLVFMLLNVQAFRLFEHSLLYETLSSRMVRQFTRGLRLPLLLIPVGAAARGLLELLIYWSFTAALLVWYLIFRGHLYLQLEPRLLIGFAGLALCLLFGTALGLFTSAIYPRVMDIRYIVRYVGQLWLFLTPVFYSLQSVPSGFRTLAEINPLTPMMGLVQYGFLGAGTVHALPLVWALAVLVLTTAGGLVFYNRHATQWIGIHNASLDDDDEDDAL